MRELIRMQCMVYWKPDYPGSCHSEPVLVEDVDMPMIKLLHRGYGRSVWHNVNKFDRIELWKP